MPGRNDSDLEQSPLFDRIWGSMLGGAIGDAMGGPVEGLTHERIAALYGRVEGLLPYSREGDYHANWSTAPGSFTDDTRLKHILCQAIMDRGGLIERGDLVKSLGDYYHTAEDERAKGFVEEYYLKGLHGERMQIWGGQAANGAVMMNSPLGMICPCDPATAFAAGYDTSFPSEGYSAYAAAIAAAAVAAAMCPGATPRSIVEQVLACSKAHHINGPLFHSWPWAQAVGQPVENAVRAAIEIADRSMDAYSLPPALYERLTISPLFSEAAQTISVALAMVYASNGDVVQSILGAVNYGRDCDSYASVAGAIAGALKGAKAIPLSWQTTVIAANPGQDMRQMALALTQIATERFRRMEETVSAVSHLMKRSACDP